MNNVLDVIVDVCAAVLIAAGAWRLLMPKRPLLRVLGNVMSAWQAIGAILAGTSRFIPDVAGAQTWTLLFGTVLLLYPMLTAWRADRQPPRAG